MTDDKKVPGLRSLLEDTFGLKIDEALRQRIEAKFGTTLDDDPSRWTDVKRSLAVEAGEDPDAEAIVRAHVDRLAAELAGAEQPTGAAQPPATWTPAERAIYATVRVAEAFEEGGLDNVEPAGARAWLDDAVDGYRLLGRSDEAELVVRVRAALANGISDQDQEELEEDWFGSIGSDRERAAWITAHKEAFRA